MGIPLVTKVVAIVAVAFLALAMAPEVFKYSDGSGGQAGRPTTLVTLINGTMNETITELPTTGNWVTDVLRDRLNDFLKWALNTLGEIERVITETVTERIQEILPGVDARVGTLLIYLMIFLVLWWKSEYATITLRAVFLTICVILLLVIFLALMGVLP